MTTLYMLVIIIYIYLWDLGKVKRYFFFIYKYTSMGCTHTCMHKKIFYMCHMT